MEPFVRMCSRRHALGNAGLLDRAICQGAYRSHVLSGSYRMSRVVSAVTGDYILGEQNNHVSAGRHDTPDMWLVQLSSEWLECGLRAGRGQAEPFEPVCNAPFLPP